MANRQASLATRVTPHAANSSQAGRYTQPVGLPSDNRQATQATGASPQVALNSQAGRQACLADSTPPQAENVVSQAFPVDSALSQVESMVCQAGYPLAFLTDSALSQTE